MVNCEVCRREVPRVTHRGVTGLRMCELCVYVWYHEGGTDVERIGEMVRRKALESQGLVMNREGA